MDLSEKSCAAVPIPPPDYLECLSMRAAADKGADVPKPASAFKAPASGPETTSLVSRAVYNVSCAHVLSDSLWAVGAGPLLAPLGPFSVTQPFRLLAPVSSFLCTCK